MKEFGTRPRFSDQAMIERETREREERALHKLEKKLEEEAQRAQPPAEASAQIPPAEVVKRLEKLEAQRPDAQGVARVSYEQIMERGREREQLRLLKNRKADAEQNRRQLAHEARCAKLIEKLAGQIAEAVSRCNELEQRQRVELCEARAGVQVLRDKLGALVVALAPGETSEQREKAVMI